MPRRKIVTARGTNNSGIISKFIVSYFRLHRQNSVPEKNSPSIGNTREKNWRINCPLKSSFTATNVLSFRVSYVRSLSCASASFTHHRNAHNDISFLRLEHGISWNTRGWGERRGERGSSAAKRRDLHKTPFTLFRLAVYELWNHFKRRNAFRSRALKQKYSFFRNYAS